MGSQDRSDYSRAVAARTRIEFALSLLQAARSELSCTVGEQHHAVKVADAALREVRKLTVLVADVVRRIP